MSIYFLCISLGVFFAIKSSVESKISNHDIIYLLCVDGDSEDTNEDSKAKKRLGSQLEVDEDEDDSARDLFNELMFHFECTFSFLQKPVTSYSSSDKDITTPPPWC